MQHKQRLAFLIPFLSPVFLGMAPFFGKLAYNSGSDPLTVAAVRTVIAAVILWLLYLIFWRQYIFIYPAGLLGCVVVGTVNGIGSLMFYTGLDLLDASLTQLLNGMYIVFAVVLTRFGGQRVTRLTIFRVTLAVVALILLTVVGTVTSGVNWLGVGLMLGNALMFAGTMLLSQRVLYEMPAQTVTLYALTTMAVLVTMVRLAYGIYAPLLEFSGDALWAIVALGITTALGRLSMFFGVKKMGGLQASLIAMTEIGVTLLLAFVFLGERLGSIQVIGVVVLATSILLMRNEEQPKAQEDTQPLPNMAGFTVFQQMAFLQAFGNEDIALTPEEMEAIRQMMGPSADMPPPPKPATGELPTAHAGDEDTSDDTLALRA